MTSTTPDLVELRSAHLWLRPLRPTDFAAVLSYRADPTVNQHIDEPMSPDQVAAHLTHWQQGWAEDDNGRALRLGVERCAESVVIGEVLVRPGPRTQRQAEIGLALHPRHQQQRLGIELTLLLLGYCFETLGMHRVIGFVDVRNQPSLRLAERVGFQREGLLRKHIYHGGRWHDEHLVAVLEDDWPEIRARRVG